MLHLATTTDYYVGIIALAGIVEIVATTHHYYYYYYYCLTNYCYKS